MNKRSVATSHTLRAAAVLAVVVVVSVVCGRLSHGGAGTGLRSIGPAHARGADVARSGARDRAGRRRRRTPLHSLVGFSNARAVRSSGTRRWGGYQSAGHPDRRQSEPAGARAGAAPGDRTGARGASRRRGREASGPCRQSDRHRCRTGEDHCRAEHHSGDACGGESSSCGPRAGEPRGGSPSPADLGRARRGRRRTAGMGGLAHRRQRSSSTGRRRYPASRE